MADLLLLAGVSALFFVVAALAQAVTGFGSALVAVPLLALVSQPVAAVVAATAVGLVLTGGAAWRERSHVDPGAARSLIVFGVAGMPVGLVVLTLVDETRLGIVIAVAMLVMVAFMASGLRIGPRGTPVAGVASGALLTSTGMNGPPLVIALIDRPPRRYRATLQVVFAVQDLVAVAAFLVLGHVDREVAVLVLGGVVGLPLGWWLGDAAFRRIPTARLRPLVLGAMVVPATWTIVSAVS